MRSVNHVNARQSVRAIVEVARNVQLWQVRILFLLVAIGMTVGLSAKVMAEGDSIQTSTKPQIINFQVSFDGIDQYYLSGQVVGVDDPDGLTVNFGDYITGHSTTTEYGGYFGYLVILAHGQTETYSAVVTSHEGVDSTRASAWVW